MKTSFAKFDPELAETMGHAFDQAWEVLQCEPLVSAAKADDIQEALALRIIHMAQRGERELIQLRNDAIAHLRGSMLHKRE